MNKHCVTLQRLTHLRNTCKTQGVDGFIVPRTNTFQLEYVPAYDERLAWLTGFTGSAGVAIILEKHATLITDGRYRIQAYKELDEAAFSIIIDPEVTLEKWFETNIPALTRIGYDPQLHTFDKIEKLLKSAKTAGFELVALSENPIDALWLDRPQASYGDVEVHPLAYAGESASDKLTRVYEKMNGAHISNLLICDPHNLAWLFNIRGSDVPHTPIALGYGLLSVNEPPQILINLTQISDDVRQHLSICGAEILDISTLHDVLRQKSQKNASFRCDRQHTSAALGQIVIDAGGTVDLGDDPITLLKAVKNAIELEGARNAHIRDGIALCRFLHWLDGAKTREPLSEIVITHQLEQFRRDTGELRDVSFSTIAGAGCNGSIVHYHATPQDHRTWMPEELLLLDSGAQYRDGTTDITRTLIHTDATAEMKDRYTRVLKGHIAIACAVYPKGANGAQLDTLARQFLWNIGCDYDHGTGHGVGSYLSVHEGPQRISKLGKTPLDIGMILSNEPGYYKADAYGIRLENLIVVKEHVFAPHVPCDAVRTFYAFETLTLCPFETQLIDLSLMSHDELAWLNHYHQRVFDMISPYLEPHVLDWLFDATRAI